MSTRPHPLAHVVVGSIIKAVFFSDSDLRWNPLQDPFNATRLATDLSLVALFTLASWAFWGIISRWDFFGSSQQTAATEQVGTSDANVWHPARERQHPLPGGDGWVPLRQFSSEWWFLASLVAAALVCALVAFVDRTMIEASPTQYSGLDYLVMIPAILLVHECIHWVTAKAVGNLDPRLRFDLGIGGLAIRLSGEMTTAQLMAIQLGPFVLLTAVPLLLAGLDVAQPIAGHLMALAMINALISSTDLVSGALLSLQLPANAIVRLGEDVEQWRRVPEC